LFWLPWLCKTGWRLIYDRNCDNSQIRQIAKFKLQTIKEDIYAQT
jgi:hypothetical protein